MSTLKVIHGGFHGQPVRHVRPLSYTLYGKDGRPFVVFDRCPIPNKPNGSLHDLIWYLDEAIARGFIAAPRAPLTIALSEPVKRQHRRAK